MTEYILLKKWTWGLMVWRWRQKWKQATEKIENAASETCRCLRKKEGGSVNQVGAGWEVAELNPEGRQVGFGWKWPSRQRGGEKEYMYTFTSSPSMN